MKNDEIKIEFKPGTRILKVIGSSQRNTIDSIQILKIIEDLGEHIKLENGILIKKNCLGIQNLKSNVSYYYINNFII